MQDIAGCRVVVGNVVAQERFVASLITDFPKASVIDRRNNPSYGYRAVHIIAEISGKPIEIQVRTSLQHLWAEVSEKSSDVLDPTIKYGGGSDQWRIFLTKGSDAVAAYEHFEKNVSNAVAAHEVLEKSIAELREDHVPDHEVQELGGKLEGITRNMGHNKQRIEELRGEMLNLRNEYTDILTEAISDLDKLKRQKQ
jgi:hypothetical protein